MNDVTFSQIFFLPVYCPVTKKPSHYTYWHSSSKKICPTCYHSDCLRKRRNYKRGKRCCRVDSHCRHTDIYMTIVEQSFCEYCNLALDKPDYMDVPSPENMHYLHINSRPGNNEDTFLAAEEETDTTSLMLAEATDKAALATGLKNQAPKNDDFLSLKQNDDIVDDSESWDKISECGSIWSIDCSIHSDIFSRTPSGRGKTNRRTFLEMLKEGSPFASDDTGTSRSLTTTTSSKSFGKGFQQTQNHRTSKKLPKEKASHTEKSKRGKTKNGDGDESIDDHWFQSDIIMPYETSKEHTKSRNKKHGRGNTNTRKNNNYNANSYNDGKTMTEKKKVQTQKREIQYDCQRGQGFSLTDHAKVNFKCGIE